MLTRYDRALAKRIGVVFSLLLVIPLAGASARDSTARSAIVRSALMDLKPVTVDVQFSLVTKDNTPVAAAPVRLVLAEVPGWQVANAGMQFVTDDKGQYQFSGTGSFKEQRRKLPTNFWTSLTSRAEVVQHFTLAAELPYLGKRWLYVADLDYFKNGSSVRMDAMRMFGVDAAGNFTVPVKFADAEYSLPGFPGKLRVPGHEVESFSVQPDATGNRWKVVLSFRRYPEPVVR